MTAPRAKVWPRLLHPPRLPVRPRSGAMAEGGRTPERRGAMAARRDPRGPAGDGESDRERTKKAPPRPPWSRAREPMPASSAAVPAGTAPGARRGGHVSGSRSPARAHRPGAPSGERSARRGPGPRPRRGAMAAQRDPRFPADDKKDERERTEKAPPRLLGRGRVSPCQPAAQRAQPGPRQAHGVEVTCAARGARPGRAGPGRGAARIGPRAGDPGP